MPQKVIIIGSKGMLGNDLVKAYSGEQVFAWDQEEIDITNKDMVLLKIKEIDPDIVINAAAYNAVDLAEEETEYEKAYKVNSLGPKYLAEACREVDAIFATYSTDYVFDGENQGGYKEDSQPNPISNYGKSKYEGEKLVQEVGGNYFIIRTSKLFGSEGTGQNVKKSFITLMQELSEKMPELKVVDEEMSCFTYTPDLAAATRFLLESKNLAGIYHIVNGDPCTWYQCAKTLFEILGKDVKLIPVSADTFPRPAKRPNYSVLLNTKLSPLRSYREALEEFIKIK